MLNIMMTLYVAILFMLLTPGVLLTLPMKNVSKLTSAFVHGLIFAVVYHFTYKMAYNMVY